MFGITRLNGGVALAAMSVFNRQTAVFQKRYGKYQVRELGFFASYIQDEGVFHIGYVGTPLRRHTSLREEMFYPKFKDNTTIPDMIIGPETLEFAGLMDEWNYAIEENPRVVSLLYKYRFAQIQGSHRSITTYEALFKYKHFHRHDKLFYPTLVEHMVPDMMYLTRIE